MLVDIKNYNSEIYFIDLCLAYLQGSKKIENIFMENKRKKGKQKEKGGCQDLA